MSKAGIRYSGNCGCWPRRKPNNTPVITEPKRRAILVRLPELLVNRFDAVAYDLRILSRSDYIRHSLEGALEFSETHEVPLLEDPELQQALAG